MLHASRKAKPAVHFTEDDNLVIIYNYFFAGQREARVGGLYPNVCVLTSYDSLDKRSFCVNH
jgi:hypothetical protein